MVDLWKQLLISLEEDLDPLVQQYVNQKLYEDIKCNFCSYPSPTSKNSSLTPEEENIIRYASGYVPMVLMKSTRELSLKNLHHLLNASVPWP